MTEGRGLDAIHLPGHLSRRRLLRLFGLAAMGSGLATCQPEPAAANPAPAGPGGSRAGGELVVASWDEPISLDPANTAAVGLNPVRLIFDSLIVQDEDFTPYPGVAESWAVSADGKAYTFRLKRGVKFHDGAPLDAHAVKFSLDRATGQQAKANFTISLVGIYQTTDVIDSLTARVVLNQPYAPFLHALAEGYYSIVSPDAARKHGMEFDRNPVGSGPYIFQEWLSKSHVTLRRNPDYGWGSTLFKHQGPAYPDRITFRLVPESLIRLATIETGEVHVAQEIPPEEVERLRRHPGLGLLNRIVPGTCAQLMLNTTEPPLDDVRIRQALEYAVNQDELCKVLFRGALTPASTLLAPGTLGHEGSLARFYRTDLAKSRALLDAAGWRLGRDGIRMRQGKRLDLAINIVSASIQSLPIKMAEVVQAQLREVGILLDIKQTDTAALFAILRAGTQQMVLGWRAGSDPEILRPLFHSSFFGKSPVARIRFKHERLDRLLEQGALEPARARRQAIYKEVQEIALQNALVVPLWNRHAFVAVRSEVRDLALDPRGDISLYDAWLSRG